eukprot:GEMP01014591.1.p1 GENE.GEMP01014591.1~~GEMP01014591.1.p1  ORF type:complete len:558 (+),score=88.04 GEMP01014591.1:128-1801(+)
MWTERDHGASISTGQSATINQLAKFFRTSSPAFEETAAFVGGFVILCFIILTLTRMTSEILIPFLWACLIVSILQPMCDTLHRILYKLGTRARTWQPPKPFCAALVLLGFTGFLVLLGYIVFFEAKVVMKNQDYYKLGFDTVEKKASHYVESAKTQFPQLRHEFFIQVMERARQEFELFVEHTKEGAGELIGSFFFTIMYVVFWLLSEGSEEETNENSHDILRKFLYLKSIAGAIYSIFIYLLLRFYAHIDMPSTMALLNFWFYFIPAVGPLIGCLLPTPLICCDSRQQAPVELAITVVIVQLVVQLFLRFVGELMLFHFSLDRHFRIHPVIILFSLALFNYMLGPSGMLLAVPSLAYLKAMAYSGDLPQIYRDFVLVSLEGDYTAIYRCNAFSSDFQQSGGISSPTSSRASKPLGHTSSRLSLDVASGLNDSIQLTRHDGYARVVGKDDAASGDAGIEGGKIKSEIDHLAEQRKMEKRFLREDSDRPTPAPPKLEPPRPDRSGFVKSDDSMGGLIKEIVYGSKKKSEPGTGSEGTRSRAASTRTQRQLTAVEEEIA